MMDALVFDLKTTLDVPALGLSEIETWYERAVAWSKRRQKG
jgi:hypothetical protein